MQSVQFSSVLSGFWVRPNLFIRFGWCLLWWRLWGWKGRGCRWFCRGRFLLYRSGLWSDFGCSYVGRQVPRCLTCLWGRGLYSKKITLIFLDVLIEFEFVAELRDFEIFDIEIGFEPGHVFIDTDENSDMEFMQVNNTLGILFKGKVIMMQGEYCFGSWRMGCLCECAIK